MIVAPEKIDEWEALYERLNKIMRDWDRTPAECIEAAREFTSAAEEGWPATIKALRDAVSDNEHLRETFGHVHESNNEDDTCRACGLDIRNSIHLSAVPGAKT